MAYSTQTTSATRYNVVNGSRSYSNLSSPFDAIGKAYNCGGDVVETNSGRTIFESNAAKYYLFQFTNFYGAVTSQTEANNWINGFAGAHVVDGRTGKFYGSNARVLKGNTFRTENNSGGYLYNFSQNTWGYKSIQTTVSLSQANLFFAPNGRKDNAYIYVAAISPDGSEVIEAGLLLDQYCRNEKVWKAYTKDGYGNYDPTVIDHVNVTNGVYKATKDVIIKMSLRDGASGIHYSVETLSGSVLASGDVDGWSNSTIRSGNNVRFLVAVSFVPDDLNTNCIQDLRDGAYFENIILESYLYTALNQDESAGAKHGFTAESNPPQYSYIYDTDTIDYTRGYNGNLNKEVINIKYNWGYKA